VLAQVRVIPSIGDERRATKTHAPPARVPTQHKPTTMSTPPHDPSDALAAVLAAHASSPVRPPPPGARVYKEESVYGFDTPLSPGGLYLNLRTWQVCAVGQA
jgi:hypothetical protein